MIFTKSNFHILLVFLLSIGIFSCKFYISHSFRQTYDDVNKVLHKGAKETPFFKVHLKNGDVSLLENWEMTATQDSLNGEGQLFDFNRKQIHEGKISLAVNEIAIIETNQIEVLKEKEKSVITSLSILTGINLIGDVLCFSNPKACYGSCPTFYIQDQQLVRSAAAEGFSSSIAPSLEKRDFDALKYRTSANSFSIIMKNEALETHCINELQLHAVPKKKSEYVFQNQFGNYYRCGELQPFEQISIDEKAKAAALQYLDGIEFYSPTDSFDLSSKEEIILEFPKLAKGDYGIVVNFRQTLLTTFLLYSGIAYMGDEVGDYFARIETKGQVKKQLDNLFDRLGKIKLSVWDERHKKWQYLDELFETGPIASNLVIVPIQHVIPQNKKLKVKVEITKGLWRIDYLGLVPILSNAQANVSIPSILEAIDGENYPIEKIQADDKDYLVTLPGNEYQITFELPELQADQEYELFLSSKGYYLEWVREDWIRGKDLVKLKKMLLNDDATWFQLAKEYKSMESEMETVFWGSKYSKIQ